MTAFGVILTSEAQLDVRHLDRATQSRTLGKLAWMGRNAELLYHRALPGEVWSGCFSYRAGSYRIIYQIDRTAERLVILKVARRRDVYP